MNENFIILFISYDTYTYFMEHYKILKYSQIFFKLYMNIYYNKEVEEMDVEKLSKQWENDYC